jgi:hypothetical protein
MIHWSKSLDQIDMPDSTTDSGKLQSHILWLWRNIDAVNDDVTAAIAGASGVEQSWVTIAIEYLVSRGAIVVDEEVNHG